MTVRLLSSLLPEGEGTRGMVPACAGMTVGRRGNEGGGRGNGDGSARDKFALPMSMCPQQGENRPR